MAGWNTQQMMDGLPGILDLAAASGEDLGTTSDIVTDALTAFGLQAKDATSFADLLASASSNSNTNVSLMGETFKYVAPLFGALGYSAEDAALATGLMANAGIKGSQAGTTLRAAVTNLMNPTDKMSAAMEKLGISVTDSKGEMLPFSDVMSNLRERFAGLSEEQQAQYAATIFGKEAMSGMLAIINASDKDYQQLTRATTDYNGAAKEMAEIMEGNLKGKINNIRSALEEAGLKIYNVMLPSLEGLADKVQTVVDWFNNLDESTQKNIVVMGGVAAAIGPVLMIVGSLSGAILKTVGVAKMLSGGFAALSGTAAATGTAIGGTVAPSWALGGAMKAGALLMNPWVLGAAAVAGGAILIGNHLKKDAIPEVERFDDTVSKSTQEVVGNFMNMTEEANAQLKELSWGQQKVTAEMAEDMQNKQQEITNTLLTSIDDRHQSEKEKAQEQYEHLKSLSTKEKEEILERIDERYDQEREKTEEGQRIISDIIQRAADDNREITELEAQTIEEIREGMTETAVKILSENEREQKVILEKMKDNASKISAKEAAEVVKNSKKKKDDVVKEANDQYDETVAWAIQQRDELGTMSESEAERVIREAKHKRDESVKNAEDMHRNVVKEAKNQAKEHVNEVDWSTGEIKSKWEVLKSDVSTKAKNMRDDVLKWVGDMADKYNTSMEKVKNKTEEWDRKLDGMRRSARTNFESVKSAAGKAFSNIKKSIQEGIDKVTAWNNKRVENKTATFTQHVKTIGSKVISGLGGLVGNNAHGTEYWGGGLTWIGEQGRELVDLPRGSKVYSNEKSEKMASGGSGFTGNVSLDISIPLDGRELARTTINFTAEELQKLKDRQRRGR